MLNIPHKCYQGMLDATKRLFSSMWNRGKY